MKTLVVAIPVLCLALSDVDAYGQGIRRVTRKSVTSPSPGIHPSPDPSVQTSIEPPLPVQPQSAAPAAALTPAAPPVRYLYRAPKPPSPNDPEVARKVLEFQKKRAEEGSAYAQYELGMRHLRGDGVAKDVQEGRKWLEKAAENGYEAAAKKLKSLDAPAPKTSTESKGSSATPPAPTKETGTPSPGFSSPLTSTNSSKSLSEN